MFYMTAHPSPIGTITLACTGDTLVGLWMEGQKYYGDTIPGTMTEKNDIPLFDTAKKWLDRYFSGKKPGISELPLAPIGGEFRQRVWQILREIPYGEVITYGDIAQRLNCKAAQAVGGAVGHNPISIMIPCHRVVGSNGSLTGFSAGIQTKIKLLELEGVDMSAFAVPKKGTAL
jgi:methylated-DNA-[protein]-cysteine S-methyltransferase